MKNSNAIGAYLAGLFEGDGTVYLPTEVTLKKKKTNPRISICFNIKDINQAQAIIDGIGFGYLTRYPKKAACKITITQVKGLRKFLDLIHNNLRTPKICQINNLIIWLNKHHNDNRVLEQVNYNHLLENSWFSGFIDADGHFMIRYTKKENGNKKDQIACRFKIEQQEIYPLNNQSYIELFELYANIFETKVKKRTQKVSKPSVLLEITKQSVLDKLILYLSKYRLYSSKYYDYLDWKTGFEILKNKQGYTEVGKQEIFDLKNQMNNKRVVGIKKIDVEELKAYLK